MLIGAVERTDKQSRMSWGYDGSAYELSGAAGRFCQLVNSETNLGNDENDELP